MNVAKAEDGQSVCYVYFCFSSKRNKMINRNYKGQSIAAMLIGPVFHVVELTKIKTLSKY